MYGTTKKALLSVVLATALAFLFFYPAIGANGNGSLTADFYWDETDIQTGEVVHFHDNSTPAPDSAIIAWQWRFGDGNSSVDENPTHTYADDGDYDVELTVIDENGSTDTATKQITIQNRPPTADAGPDQVVNTSQVSFDGTGSSDPDGSIASYTWYFGDNTTGTGPTPTHTYDDDGLYLVTLNVTDDDGGTDENTTEVYVDTQPPNTTCNLNGTAGDNDWYTSNVTVTLTAEDNLGVDAVYYKIDDGNWTLYQTSFAVTAEGDNRVYYYAVDDAGNKESIQNTSIKIDKTKPSVTITTPEEGYIYLFGRRLLPTIRGNTYAFGRITIEATVDASPADTDKVRFLVDDDVQFTDFEEPYSWRWGMAFGRHTVGVKAIDMAGQSSTVERDISIISLLPGGQGTTAASAAPSDATLS